MAATPTPLAVQLTFEQTQFQAGIAKVQGDLQRRVVAPAVDAQKQLEQTNQKVARSFTGVSAAMRNISPLMDAGTARIVNFGAAGVSSIQSMIEGLRAMGLAWKLALGIGLIGVAATVIGFIVEFTRRTDEATTKVDELAEASKKFREEMQLLTAREILFGSPETASKIRAVTGEIENTIKKFAEVTGLSMDQAAQAIALTTRHTEDQRKEWEKYYSATVKSTKVVAGFSNSLGEVIEVEDEAATKARKLSGQIYNLTQAYHDLRTELALLQTEQSVFDALEKETAALVAQLDSADWERQMKGVESWADDFLNAKDSMAGATDQLAMLREQQNELTASGQRWYRLIDPAAAKWADMFDRVREVGASTFASILDAGSNAFVGLMIHGGNFGEMMIGILQMAGQAFVKFALEMFVEWISTMISSIIAGSFAAYSHIPFVGFALATAAAVAAIAGARSMAKKYGGREFAEGGIVMGPVLGLVGEAGPEMIIPLSDWETRMRHGSGDINITLEVDGRAMARATVPHIPGEIRRKGIR